MKYILEFLKAGLEYLKDFVTHRLFPVLLVCFILVSLLVQRLYKIQILEGKDYMDDFVYKSEKTVDIDAVRGNIYDVNGRLIAYNELSYNVTFENYAGLDKLAKEQGITANDLKNDVLYRTIKILEDNGETLYIDFPIEYIGGEYKFLYSDTKLKNFKKDVYSQKDYEKLTDEQQNSTAEDVVYYLRDKVFKITGEYDDEMMLKIVACRYKLWLNRYQQYMSITLAYDVSDETNAIISENQDSLYGVNTVVKSIRKYNNAEYYAHILGYVGAISPEELEEYNANLEKEEYYKNTEMVGKAGIEKSMESYLRGGTGYEKVYVDNLGKVIETVESRPATAGNDIYLTIDTDLQKYCYDTLEKELASIIVNYMIPDLHYEYPGSGDIYVSTGEVLFGLFDNNYIRIDDLGRSDATTNEKNAYNAFLSSKESTMSQLRVYLSDESALVGGLGYPYYGYMEYICEMLHSEGVFDPTVFEENDSQYMSYIDGNLSIKTFLKYAISSNAIDVTTFEEDGMYYSNEEIYDLLVDYIIEKLSESEEFDKQIFKSLIESGSLSSITVIEIFYDQGILNRDGDKDYVALQAGNFGAYDFMKAKLQSLEITPAMIAVYPYGGSMVVTDIHTGKVKALVSYPSYDANLLTNEVNAEYYNKLLNDKTSPLLNRATTQKIAPGSTFKPLMAFAGLDTGTITTNTVFVCNKIFDKVQPEAKCLDTHGGLAVDMGIQRSCNCFFYNVGYNMSITENKKYSEKLGMETIQRYCDEFGLSDTSGVELTETEPSVSDADPVRSAIGQSTHAYTCVGLSRYVTTIANRGTCYELTLLDRVYDNKGEIVLANQAKVRNTISVESYIWDTVQLGMRKVVTGNMNSAWLASMKVPIAGKTGTSQESKSKPNHAIFISFAPYGDPDISVTCVIPYGYYSNTAKEAVGFIYAYLYDPEKLKDASFNNLEIDLD